VQRIFSFARRGRFHDQLIGDDLFFAVLASAVLAVLNGIDHEGDVAAFDNVVHSQGPVGYTQAFAVERGAVGAAQVADAPTVASGIDFGVLPAHRAFVQDNFQGVLAADSQSAGGLPDLLGIVRINHAKANAALHATLLFA